MPTAEDQDDDRRRLPAGRPPAQGLRLQALAVRRALIAGLLFAGVLAAPRAAAAAPPLVAESWASAVTSTSVYLRAKIDPEGLTTSYRFEYLTEAAYEANLSAAREAFAGASVAPPSGHSGIGSGTTAIAVVQYVTPLAPQTSYRYRVVATSSGGETDGPVRFFATLAPVNELAPPDGRAFELVSPVDKGGGAIAAPGGLFGGGEFQAAAAGGAFTYSSGTAFGAAAGAPPGSQYISRRGAGGWASENVSQPLLSEGYGAEPDGVPYRVFSEDLARALLLDPRRCEAGDPCPRGYSLRESASGALTPLPPAAAGMRVLSVSPDLGRVWFEDEAGEVWEWSGGGALAPAAAPPEPSGAERISADGLHRVFLTAAEIPPFDNIDANTGEPDTEVYLEGPPPGGGPSRLVCVSCNPTGERPEGSATIPGALVNGSTAVYEPRVLSASGNRVFFESADDLALNDTNSRPDVYEWEAAGEGDCTLAPGCQSLVSGGRGAGATFLDASDDGTDVFFLTEASLLGADPGSIDVYDARAGGGFPEPEAPFVCTGDLCQPLPSPPDDPSPGTLRPNSGNPPQKYYSEHRRGRRCPKGKVRRKVKGKKGKARSSCVKPHHGRHRHKVRHGKRTHRRGR